MSDEILPDALDELGGGTSAGSVDNDEALPIHPGALGRLRGIQPPPPDTSARSAR
jgi:hypothetical protein